MKVYQIISLILAIASGIFIFYISSLSFPPTIPGFSLTSVIYHFGIFLLFSFFLLLSVKFDKKFIFLIFLISLVYAGLDELHQYFVPNRVADFFDLGVDFLGSFVSFLVLGFIYLRRR